MKKYYPILLAVLILLTASACTDGEKAAQEKVKPVKTITLEEQRQPAVLDYAGTVTAGELKKLSFKSTGKISEILVEEGQRIRKGDILIRLDTQELKFALAAAEAQMEAARSAYEKAVNGATTEELRNAELNVKKVQDAYDYAASSYKRVDFLYAGGAASKNDLEQAKLELDVKESELNQAKELLNQLKKGARSEDRQLLIKQLEQARADYDYRVAMLEDAVMRSDCDGYVVELMYEKGELVPAGYPAAAVRSEGLVVNVGLAEKDRDRVKVGSAARISVGGRVVEGTVSVISQVPDTRTGAYITEIIVEDRDLNIGSIAAVEIITGEEAGIWIPLTSMLSDGMDYVFVARDAMAEKREIEIEAIRGSMAKVKGLAPGEQLVVEGMKRLRAGDGISVVK